MENLATNSGLSVETNLVRAVRAFGPIEVARVSSAQARGRAKQYSYYGTAIYRLSVRNQMLRLECVSGASSDRRSLRLAQRDAAATGLPVVSGLSADAVARELCGVR